jgi:hypothetical protein
MAQFIMNQQTKQALELQVYYRDAADDAFRSQCGSGVIEWRHAIVFLLAKIRSARASLLFLERW